MIVDIIEAGLSGALQGLVFAIVIFVPTFIHYKFKFRKHLKSSLLPAPDSNQMCFEHKGKIYSYTEFLRLRTIAKLKQNENALKKEYNTFCSGKAKKPCQEIECLAANAALILKKCNKNYENYATTTSNWIVKNRSQIAKSPLSAFEPLYQMLSNTQKNNQVTISKKEPTEQSDCKTTLTPTPIAPHQKPTAIYLVGKDISSGVYTLVSYSKEDGFIQIYEDDIYVKSVLISKKKKVNFKSGTKYVLYDCDIKGN